MECLPFPFSPCQFRVPRHPECPSLKFMQNLRTSLHSKVEADHAFAPFVLSFFISVPGGILNPPKTKPATATIPALPTAYANSLPAHQYSVQNRMGPRARPIWPTSQSD